MCRIHSTSSRGVLCAQVEGVQEVVIPLTLNALWWQEFMESRQKEGSNIPQALTGRFFTSKAGGVTHYFFQVPLSSWEGISGHQLYQLPFLQKLSRQFLTFLSSVLFTNHRLLHVHKILSPEVCQMSKPLVLP